MTRVLIHAAGYQGPESVHTIALRAFASELSADTQDLARVQTTEDITQSDRQAIDLLHLVESGEIAVCYFSSSFLSKRAPALGILDLPFAFRQRQDAYALLESIGPSLASAVADVCDLRVLGFWDNGFRHITNAIRVIREPADCAGLRIRTLDNELHKRAFASLGFEPIPIDASRLSAAVRDGLVDAQENPLTNTYGFGIHKFHPYLTLTTHFWGAALLLVHGPTYAAWPEPLRAAVNHAALQATRLQRQAAAGEDTRLLTLLRREGVQITDLSPIERRVFAAALSPLFTESCGRLEPLLPEAVRLLSRQRTVEYGD